MKKTLALLLLFLSCSTLTFAQLKKKKVKWGKIPDSDLQMQYYEQDSLAEAVVLEDIGYLHFTVKHRRFIYSLRKHKRVKILSEAGFDQGDVIINYLSRDKIEIIKGLKVKVFNPDGNKYELSDDHIFKEKIDENFSSLRFTCPNLQVGSVIEYKYEIQSQNFLFLRDWYFQYDIPVRYSEFTYERIPLLSYIVSYQNGFYVQTHKDYYIMKNVPAMKEEPFITTMNDYRGKIKFQIQSINTDYGYEPLFSRWEDIAKSLYRSKYFGQIYKKQKKVEQCYNEIRLALSRAKDEENKMGIVYDYVTKHFKWNEDYHLYASSDKVDEIIKDKRGNSADINLILISLLRKAGIDANPVLTNPRSEGYISRLYPFWGQFGHVFVCADMQNGKRVLMDGTDPLRPIDYIDQEVLNRAGLLIKDNGDIAWIDHEVKVGKSIFMVDLTINEDDELEGKMSCKYSGYNAIPERRHYQEERTGKHWIDRLSQKYPDIMIDSVQVENLGDLSNDFKENFQVIIPDAYSEAGDLLYIGTDYYSDFSENPFLSETRTFPVDFAFPFEESSIFRFKVPEGYEVESLPESISYSNEDNSAKLKLVVSQSGNDIQIMKRLSVKKTLFFSDEYHSLKALFDLSAEKSKTMIVLRRAKD